MKEKGNLHVLKENFTGFLEVPQAFLDPRSLHIVSLLKNAEMLPEDVCAQASYDEKTVVGILLNLHVYGILKRKQKGFKGFYSISKDNILKYCERLKELSEKWESLIKEVECKK